MNERMKKRSMKYVLIKTMTPDRDKSTKCRVTTEWDTAKTSFCIWFHTDFPV